MLDIFQICNQSLIVTGRLIRTTRIEQEWYDNVREPEEIVKGLRQNSIKADIFTFRQCLPEVTPIYKYYMEFEDIAVLSIKDYDYWWSKQINSSTRAMVRKALKKGVTVREVDFNDEFVRGMVNIFNESPMRQGKPFLHYGKDFETIKKDFSRYLFREEIFGAYYNGDLIGFIMLGYGDNNVAFLGQIISKIEHRDKAPNNALIAEAVEICGRKKIPYLVYAHWNLGSLADFKRHHGFQKVSLPRYYIPLTAKGKVALRLAFHRGLEGMIPENIKGSLVKLRSRWYERVLTLKDQNYNAPNAAP